jgi:hypothetical protein
LHAEFERFTQAALTRLYSRCQIMLEKHGIKRPEPGHFEVYFIRRGDKLLAESLDIPSEAYLRSMASRAPSPLLAIGDDDFFIDSLKTRLPTLSCFSPFPPLAGSTLDRRVSLERTLSIMSHFCVLCEARKVIGDPHCNLVAAALAVRGERYSADRQLFPWPRQLVI